MGLWLSELGDFGPPTNVTIVSGVVAAGGSRNLILNAETGVTDALTQITGVPVGKMVSVSAASGDTITVTDGAKLNLARSDFILNTVRDKMLLKVTAIGVCDEQSRSRNT